MAAAVVAVIGSGCTGRQTEAGAIRIWKGDGTMAMATATMRTTKMMHSNYINIYIITLYDYLNATHVMLRKPRDSTLIHGILT